MYYIKNNFTYMNKQDIKTACIKNQKEIIHDIEELMSEHMSLADIDENETKDVEDFSHQDESTEMVMNLKVRLARAKSEFEILQSLPNTPSESIALGAIAQTDMGFFYISIPSKMVYQENKIHCISTAAPFYASIKGKKVGDEFIFNNETHKIVAIY